MLCQNELTKILKVDVQLHIIVPVRIVIVCYQFKTRYILLSDTNTCTLILSRAVYDP